MNKRHYTKVFARVSGVLVALDMPDPRTEGGVLRNFLGGILVVVLSLVVIYLLGKMQEVCG